MNELNERLAAYGPAVMTEAELLAMVLGGTRKANHPDLANRVLSSIGSSHSLPSRRAGELASIPGMTHARAHRFMAAVELGRRASIPPKDCEVLRSSADVARHCARLATDSNEVFLALSLNSRNRVIGGMGGCQGLGVRREPHTPDGLHPPDQGIRGQDHLRSQSPLRGSNPQRGRHQVHIPVSRSCDDPENQDPGPRGRGLGRGSQPAGARGGPPVNRIVR